jgi:hypothetical protein
MNGTATPGESIARNIIGRHRDKLGVDFDQGHRDVRHAERQRHACSTNAGAKIDSAIAGMPAGCGSEQNRVMPDAMAPLLLF